MPTREILFAFLLAVGGLLGAGLEAQTTDDLLFIHHSCGQNWLDNSLNDALLAKTYIDERNDVTYGVTVAPDSGRPASLGDVAGENTNMNHWILWFNDYLASIKAHDCGSGTNKIIMFKSCYPASDIEADGTEPGSPFSEDQSLVNYKSVYRHPSGSGNTYTQDGYTYQALEDVFAANPGVLFIPVTAPSRIPSETSVGNADRARKFNTWLKGEWLTNYQARTGLKNVAVFDWFDLLANPDTAGDSERNMTKTSYRTGDSHPNDTANAYSTKIFATNSDNFLDIAWAAFESASIQYTLTMAVAPDGAGTTDPAVGAHTVTSPQSLTATAAAGFYFKNWTGTGNASFADSNASKTTLTLTGDAGATANFAAIPATATLTMAVSPEGAGATEPALGTHTVNTQENFNISVTPGDQYEFSSWTITTNAGTVTSSTSATTTALLYDQATLTAVLTPIVPATSIAAGSLLTLSPEDLTDFDGDQFYKKPKVYGVYDDPVKGTADRQAGLKVAFDKNSPESVRCEWTKAIPLLNVKDIPKTQTTADYLADLPDGEIAAVPGELMVQTIDAAGAKNIYAAGDLSLVPPTISQVYAADGTTVITSAGPGATIIVTGAFFGAPLPQVWLEYVKNGIVKALKCRVDKAGLIYEDANGKPCGMVVDSAAADYGASQLTVVLPDKWPTGWNDESTEHNIVIDNKTGRATIAFSTSD